MLKSAYYQMWLDLLICPLAWNQLFHVACPLVTYHKHTITKHNKDKYTIYQITTIRETENTIKYTRNSRIKK